ncbi:two-partner secretion domain-containing protein [Janthinobacterium aestuarii]
MNKNLYRIIFNKRRGQLMVVAENASSQGKAAKGEGSLDSGVFDGDGGGGINGRLRPLALAIFGALGMVTFVAGPAMGQIVADPNAPGRQRPTVVQSANGVTQVNIQTSSAAGVSRNTYNQFDVTANGAILNNSRGNVQTQTGGWVQGNPWLAGGSARVILNEVNSANPSQLRGYVEVAGQRAEVVIANPAGVAIDGGGFINASRVVLTTGSPILNGGSLDGYMVQRGVVTINGRGLDTSLSDYTAILARAAQINGGIWAQELKVVTGANQIDAAHGVTGAASGVGPAPAYALDVAQLGGMYAGKITLIGTEAGLGVRNAGVLAATAGNLVLQSNGWLSNSGNIQSVGTGSQTGIAVTGDVVNSGTVYAGGDSQVQAQGNIASSGLIAAQNNVTMQASGAGSHIDLAASAVIASGLNTDNSVRQAGDLRIEAGDTIRIHGNSVSGGNSQIAAGQLDLKDARVSGAQLNLSASAGDLDASRASIATQGGLSLNATATVRTDGAVVTANQIDLRAHDLSNIGGQISQFGSSDLLLQLPGTLNNSSGRIASNSQNLAIRTQLLYNVDGKMEHAGTGAFTMAVADTLLGQRGRIITNGGLSLDASKLDHRDAVMSAQQVGIKSVVLDNRGGSISQTGSGQASLLATQSLDNRAGSIELGGNAAIATSLLSNAKGRITSTQSINVKAGSELNNHAGIVASGQNLTLEAGSIENTEGTLQAFAGQVNFQFADMNNTAGSIFAGSNANFQGGNAYSSGSVYAVGNLALNLGGKLTNTGVIAAHGNNSIRADSLISVAGSLIGAGVKSDGGLAAAGDLTVNVSHDLAAHGQNLAAGTARLNAASVNLDASQTSASQIAMAASAGNVSSAGAVISTPGTLSITANANTNQVLDNNKGTLSAGQLDVALSGLNNRDGVIIQTGAGDTNIVLKSPSGLLDNTRGRIAVNSRGLDIAASSVTNTQGRIEHAGSGNLSLQASVLNDEQGTLISNGTVHIVADAMQHDGAVTSANRLTVDVNVLSNHAGQLVQTGTGDAVFTVRQGLDNAAGEITSNGTLSLQAGSVDNTKGRITSAAAASISSKGQLENRDGVISTGSDLAFKIAGDFSNSGLMYAGRDQQWTVGGALTNSGSIAALGNTTLHANSIASSGLLGAGLQADGSLGTSGNLSLTATQGIVAGGQNLAAGQASLTGTSLDLSGSQTGAANINLTATQGNVLTHGAVVSTPGLLSITANAGSAQALVNTGKGQLSAGQLALQVANLDNSGGDIVQTGQGKTVIATGLLNNTGGRIAVNSSDLSLEAATLTNLNGRIEHAGTGVLAITANSLNGQGGKLIGNGALRIDAGSIDHRDATLVAQQVTIQAGSLDNRGGGIGQTGAGSMTLGIGQLLDNTGGRIESNGDLAVTAGSVLNQQGLLSAVQQAVLTVTGKIDNTTGMLAAGQHLRITAQQLDNLGGKVQAQNGNATLQLQQLHNTGSVFAGGNLDTQADMVRNSGSLYAAGEQRLQVTGTLANTGVIAAQGDNHITAERIDSGAQSLLGAGIKADGSLAQSGDLTLTATQAITASGQNLAAGHASLTGASLDLGLSQTSAGSIDLTASHGNISTAGAVVSTPGLLNITANSLEQQTLQNAKGTLSAGQLAVQVGQLDNQGGKLLQTGTDKASVTVRGQLDNSQAGELASNGQLLVQAGSIDNSGKGRITSTASLDLKSINAVNNTDGVIAATQDILVTAGSVDNSGGTLQASGGSIVLDAGSVRNAQGVLSAGKDVRATLTGDLNNTGLLYAGRDQQWTVGGALANSGSIAALGNTTLQANSIASSGLLGAGLQADGSLGTSGNLSLTATQGIVATGQNLAAGQANLTGTSLDLSGSQTGAANINLTATQGNVLTHGAVVSTPGLLSITANAGSAQALVNTGKGQLSAGQLALQVANLDNSGGDIVQTGQGKTVIATGLLNNTGGRIAVNSSDLGLSAATLTNLNGRIEHAGNGVLAITANSLNGQGGKLIGNGALRIDAGSIDHRDATLVAQQVTIQAGSLDNRGGGIGQTGAGSMTLGIGQLLDNTGGRIESNGDLAVTAGSVLNQQGLLSAVQQAVLTVTGKIDNTTGMLAAGQHLRITAQQLDNLGGKVQAQNGNATLQLQQLHNTGSVFAGGNLDTQADMVRNSGSLYAAGEQRLQVTGTLANTGVIAAQGDNHITAERIDSGAQSLLGAGIKADGSLAQSGDLTLTATQAITASGQNLAAGHASLTGASLDLGLSQTSAGSIDLTASHGNISTAGAVVSTPGLLNITANSLEQQTLQNAKGTLSAGQLAVQVGQLDNQGGKLLQTGTGTAQVTVGGQLDNSQAGELASNGQLLVQAGSIDNSGKGRITSTASLDLKSVNAVNNTDGVIAATQDILVKAGSVDNSGGTLQASSGSIVLDARSVRNAQGVLSAGRDVRATLTGDLNNTGLLYAGRDQQWTVGGALTNSGSIAALGNTILHANSIASSGLLGAGLQADGSLGTSGNLSLTTTQGIVASGQNLAAGQASLTGTSLDLSGSQTGAANINLTATQGNVLTHGAVVSTPGLLSITANAGSAQALVNTGKGQLSAGQLALQVANLDNSGGDIVQTGQGKTVIATDLLNNTGGRIAVNSSDLSLSAATLTNLNGRIEHAGNGVLAITASTLNGQGGKLIGNGALRIDAGSIDHRDATLVAQQVTIQAGSLDNRGGGIGQTGAGSMTLGIGQLLDNTGGRIESNGDLAVTAGSVLNQQGLLSAVQQATIGALGKIDNTAGSVAAGLHLRITAQQLDNLGGKVQAQNGNATLQLQQLHNTGSVFAGGNLDTQADMVRNSGSLYAAGEQRLQVTGTLANTGVIAAQGDNHITAERIDSGAQSLLGAGIKADGSLAQSGDLTLTATQAITASGQNLAAGHASLTGASLDLGLSQTSAGSIDLTASHGNISTAGAVVSTPGLLSITANSLEQQTLQNAKGTLSAGQLAVQVGQLDNQGGKLLQTGTDKASVTVRGQLDNSQAGELASNGQLLVQAGSIDNSGKGRITSTASLDLKSVNAVKNTDGVIAATQDISVKAGSVDNSGGTLQASGGSIVLDAGSVRNAQGVLSAGKDVRATLTGDLNNTGLLYAGRDQQWTVGGALTNSGSIAALGNTILQANSIASSGLLGAGLQADGSLGTSGNLSLTATQGIVAGGQNLAAGQASLTGTSLDLSGSQTGAANINLTATQGNVLTHGAVVSTPGLLSITANAGSAQALVNTGKGQLSAGQLALQVANLDNSGGDIVQTGQGKTVIATGLLNNTGGRIAVNSSDLSLSAATLTNLNGRIEHAGNGVLAITASTLNGQGGKLIGNGALRIDAGSIDHRDATLVAQQVTLQAGSLDNRGGHLVQTGLGQTDIKVSQALNNGLGEIASNGMLAIHAGTLGNAGGQISANQGASIDVTSGFVNTDGVIAAVQDLSLSAASIDNQGGNLRAVGGDVTLQATDFGNKGGSVYAGHDLKSTVVNLSNSGSLYATGNQVLQASGSVENSGVIAALGNTDIHAASFRSQGAASLLGAGIKADGTLSNSANLNITATQELLAGGQNLATGNAIFAGASVDVSGSKTSAANITLTANTGNVTTSSAVVSASGALTVNAGTQDGQSWVNRMGEASAGQLSVHAANLDNSKGTIIQSGTGDGAISVSSATGILDNTGGRIAVNANNFSLTAKTLLNVDGKMEHASSGIFAIGAGNFTGDRGWITSNGSVKIDAGTFNHGGASLVARQVSIEAQALNNAKGSITQLGTAHSDIKVSGRLDNNEGVIASNGDIAIKAGDLDNRLGTLQAAGTAQLDLAITGTLDNRKLNSADKGLIAAGGKVSITAGELLNQQGKVTAGTTLEVGVGNGIENAGGLLAATGNVIVTGASLNNAGGTLASVGGNVQATLSGLMHNAGGKVQAGGDVILNNHGLTNSDGASITGRNVAIDSNGQELNNRLGTIAGTQSVNLQTGAIQNAGGRMQAGTSLSVDTHGQVLNNANTGNITSGGTVNLAVGNVNNAGGYIGAAGAITGHAGQIDNTANGAIVGQSTLNLTIGGLNNQGGQIQVLGDLGLNTAGTIANQQGLIRGGGTVTLSGAAIENSNTQTSNQGIEGINLALTASNVINSQGALRADNNLTLLSSGVINNQGLISAGNALSIRDLGPARSLSFSNSGGTAIAGKNLEVRAASLSGDGSLLSQQDLTLDLSGNYSHGNGGKITANGNASIVVGGNLSNAGVLQAGGLLDLRAGSLDNAMAGDIHATTTRVSTSGTLNNRGLIDGINTEVNAGVLNNVGSGRIYGDHLSIAAGAIDNNVEAGQAAVIAARTRLDIGAQTINNNEHALIFSAGDMAIGGALDASRFAVGQAVQLTNASAEIEALGNMRLDVARVDNLNKHFTLQLGANTVEEINEYQLPGQNYRTQTEPEPGCLGSQCIAEDDGFTEYTQYTYTRTTTNSTILTSDPGKILAGGSLTISSGKVINENSHIIAGGLLSIIPGALLNTSTQSVSMITERGVAMTYLIPNQVGGGLDVVDMWTPVNTGSVVYERDIPGQSAPVTAGRVEGNTAVSATGKRPDAVAGIGGLSGTSGAGKANAGISLAGVAQGSTGVATVQNVNGQGATAATGAGTVNSTDRAGSAGQAGDVAKATGTAVAAVQGGAVHDSVGMSRASDVSTAAQGRDANNTAKLADSAKGGKVSAVDAATAGNANPLVTADGSVDAKALERAVNGKAPGAITGAGGVNHSDRAGDAGRGGAVAAIAGISAGAANGGATGMADPSALAGAVNSGAAGTVAAVNGPNASDRTGSAGQRGSITVASGTKVGVASGAAAENSAGPLAGAVVGAAAGEAVNAASGANAPAGTKVQAIGQVALASPSGRAQVVRTTLPSMQLPTASLFKLSPAPGARFLVETDPRFTNYRDWTGSDYLLAQVQLDPSVTQKRLGDGFYEQRLVREQIAQLTGQRFVGDYTGDEEQYKGLMDAGANYAKQWDLRPGVALTAEQMAALTSDIVWLVEQDVTLADGSTQKALVPQVYVRLREGDIDGSGALLAGKDVDINLKGDLTNSGTIAGRDIVRLTAENVQNMGGRIDGDAVGIAARNDLNNIGGAISANSELIVTAGRDINITSTINTNTGRQGDAALTGTGIGRVAGLYVSDEGGTLAASAGRDISLLAGEINNSGKNGATVIKAGGNLALGTLTTGDNANLVWGGDYSAGKAGTSQETGSTITGAGSVSMNVGGDINSRYSNVQAGTALAVIAGRDINNNGSTFTAANHLQASAGRDINLVTTTVSDSHVRMDGRNTISDSSTVVDKVAGLYVTGTGEGNTLIAQAGRDMTLTAGIIANAGVNGQTALIAGNNLNLNTVTVASTHNEVRNTNNYSKQSKTSEVGSQIMGAGNVNLQAGHDLLARAADVQAQGTLGLVAGNDISLVNGLQNEVSDVASKSTKSGFWNKTTTIKHDVVDTTTAIGTSLGGSSVTVQAGRDLQVTGSSILSDDATKLFAGNNITIDAATNTVYELHHSSTKKSGFMSSGGIGFSYGTKTTTVDQERDATLQSGEARSSIGATGGALTMVAGNNVTIGGSDILAATDLDIIGKSVTIKPGQDNEKGKFEVKTTQDGLTLALGGSVISAIQTLQTMSKAASTAKDGRVTAMAAATAAMAANDAAKEMMKEGPSISISLTAGHSESIQTQTTASTTHSGSVLTGNNINITAMGGGKDSNINILGSDLNAKNDIRLDADNNVNLLAAQDTESQHSKSSSMSASAGVAASVSTKGMSFGFTASVSGSKGHEDGDGTTQLNTHVNAGDKLVITSGGDTNIKGAVASANQVIADIKGNLNLESLQDTAKFDSKNQSFSASGTVGYGASFSASYSQSNMHNDYASVQEQSGIKAGDGGFQIKVGDNTDLKGAVISATEAGKLNSSLTTATLTYSDIANHAISKGSSVGVSGGMSFAGTGPKNDNLTNVGGEKDATTKSLPSIVALSENASSTTRSGISGGTLVISDDAAQRAATGKGADDAIAGVNRDVTTGIDSSGKIGNNFDKAKLQATMDVTAAFAAAAAEKLGTYASEKLGEATALAAEAHDLRETDPERSAELTRQSVELTQNWKEGGLARVALHTAIGALAGGANGALGAGAAALSTDSIAKQLKQLDMPETLRDALTLAAGAAVGAAAGGATGAAAAANEVANNYLKHEEILELGQQEAACDGGKGNADACEKANKLRFTSADRDAELAACTGNNGAKCEELRSLVLGSVMGIVQQRDGYSDENYIVESNRTFDIAISSGSTDGVDPRSISYDSSTEGVRIFTRNDENNNAGQRNADAYPPTRSLIGDVYRFSMRETLDSSNSWDVRAGYGTTALISAIPGMYNDMSSGFLNSPNNLIGGSNYMVDGWKDGNWNLFSAGLMRTGIGVLDLGGGAFVLKGSITANLKAQEYAAYSAYSRSTYQASATAENQILLNQNPRIIAGAEPSSLLQQPGAVDNLLYGARVGEGLPGAQGVVIPGRPTTDQLANLSAKHNVEFGVTYTLGNGKGGSGGFYTLYSGTKSTVSIGEISGDKMLISHTHPDGAAFASGYYEIVNGREVFKGDQGVLQLLQKAGSPQRTSTIIPLERSDGVKAPPFKFSVEDSNLDYGISNGTIVPRR